MLSQGVIRGFEIVVWFIRCCCTDGECGRVSLDVLSTTGMPVWHCGNISSGRSYLSGEGVISMMNCPVLFV